MPDVLESVDELPAAITTIVEAGMHGDYTPVFRKILQDFQHRHGEFFDAELSPGGNGWPALAETTVARKGHEKILFETGRLRASLESVTSDSIREIVGDENSPGFTFGTSVEYAIYHQLGGRLKVREHVGVNDPMLDEMVEDIADHITGTIVLGPLN